MPGKAAAVRVGESLEGQVAGMATKLGLIANRQVAVGRRIWGAKRYIDVVIRDPKSSLSLGLECKFQGGSGTAEEKIPATLQDIRAWPIRGIVVFHGAGFSQNMKSFLVSTGMAVELCDLEDWLKLYFAL